METKANYTVIGLFTLAIIAAVFGFVYWFQHIDGGGERAVYRILFQSSVSGLRTGSAVLFNGIRVGEVTHINLLPDSPSQVAAIIAIDKAVKVRPDTKAGVEFQGLTGIAAVALSGGSPGDPPLQGSATNPPTISVSPASTQDVTQGAREVLKRIDDFIEENRAVFNSTLKNIDTFSAALASNSKRLDNILTGIESLTGGTDGKGGDINEAARSLKSLADRLNNETAPDLQKLVNNLDKRTDSLTKEFNELANAGTKNIDLISRDLRRTLNDIDRTVNNIDKNPSRLLFGGSGSSTKGNQ